MTPPGAAQWEAQRRHLPTEGNFAQEVAARAMASACESRQPLVAQWRALAPSIVSVGEVG